MGKSEALVHVFDQLCRMMSGAIIKMMQVATAMVLVPAALFSQEVEVPLRFRELTHDFQTIKEGGGTVSHEFAFTNKSGRPVKILTVKPSCGCTTPAWTREPVASGASGFIKASFDPAGRPGYFNKSLSVTTDFSPQPIVLQIKGNVQTGEESASPTSGFGVTKGSLLFQVPSFNLGKVYIKDEPLIKEFPVYNNGPKPVSFLSYNNAPYFEVEAVPARLEPGSPGLIRVSFDANRKGAYGFISENITLVTDDAGDHHKSFSVFATLEEYFPPMTAKELELAPRLEIDTIELDLKDVRMGGTVSRDVRLVNAGKKDLMIRAIQPNCTCLSASVTVQSIKPGGSAVLTVVFTPSGKKGAQQKAVTLHVGDPRNPIQRVLVNARVI